jgi:hypothetical protein
MEAIGSLQVVEYIGKFRDHKNNRIRANALKALLRLGVRDCITDIESMLLDKKELMRASATWVIGEIGEEEQELRNLLTIVKSDQSPIVQRNYEKAINKFRARDLLDKRDPDEELLCCILSVIGSGQMLSNGELGIDRDQLNARAKLVPGLSPETVNHLMEGFVRIGLLEAKSGDDLTLFLPDVEVLNLYLEYKKHLRENNVPEWTGLSAPSISLLHNILYEGERSGKSEKNGISIGFSHISGLSKDTWEFSASLDELREQQVILIIDEDGTKVVFYQIPFVQHVLKINTWLGRFQEMN